ncbi:MAG: sigma-70 family RNA polymerase sigma factor [Polyangiales bacterium]
MTTAHPSLQLPVVEARSLRDIDDSTATEQGEFESIFRAEFSYVSRSLRRLGVRTRDLDDLAHDVFLVFYRRLADFDRGREIRPWLFAIALRVASDYRKRAGHQREQLGDAPELLDPAPPADERLASDQARRLVMDALQAIDLDRRAVFVMHDLDEHPMKEIAESLGVPLFTAYSRLRVAREEFSAAVRRIQLQRGARCPE